MGYDVRSLATLATQASQYFTQAIPGALVRLWPNTFRVFGKVLALLDFEHELRRAWLFKQQFSSTADERWLIRHGYELGLTLDPGNPANGTVTVTAPAGTVVPAGIGWSRADGATYTTLVATTSTGATVDLAVQSDLVGSTYDMATGDTLQLVVDGNVPFVLGDTATVAAGGLTGGTDAEDLETFRARVLYRKRNPPQGGSAADYAEWAGEALAAVKAVYVDSFQNDARAVWVCFTVSDQPGNVPDAGQVATVQAYLADPVRRPVTARVFAVAPTPVPVPIAIRGLSPDTPDTRGAVAAELAALQLDEMEPATPTRPFTLFVETIQAAINRATGVRSFTLVSPAADITFAIGSQLPELQAPTYSS